MRLPEPAAELAWQEPFAAAREYNLPSQAFVLLHSALPDTRGRRVSYLALNARHILQSGHLEDWRRHRAPEALPQFGFLGYEAWRQMEFLQAEGIPTTAPAFVPLPLLWWMQPRTLLVFDHVARRLHCHGEMPCAAKAAHPPQPMPKVVALGSSHSHPRYLAAVGEILGRIHQGAYYQANLTRKIFGLWDQAPCPLERFAALCAISPAPYAALISNGDWAVLSSSMESFLEFAADGRVRTRPIKGTIARGGDGTDDATQRARLLGSEKDRAENRMIVDLMRNDLARHCLPGSVQVSSLCALESYAQLHHLVSTIEAQRAPETDIREVLLGCFPPGSMTGAPKRAAIHALAALEPMARGVYAGTLGYLGREEAAFSVVIRTLVMQEARFEFQVGGGIVSDSEAPSEWRESLTKARGLAALLGLSETQLATL